MSDRPFRPGDRVRERANPEAVGVVAEVLTAGELAARYDDPRIARDDARPACAVVDRNGVVQPYLCVELELDPEATS